jgi:hypothetical protein
MTVESPPPSFRFNSHKFAFMADVAALGTRFNCSGSAVIVFREIRWDIGRNACAGRRIALAFRCRSKEAS